MKKERCRCRRGRRRCLLFKHDGHAVPHRVLATKAERKRGADKFYYWNTGRIWPILKNKKEHQNAIEACIKIVKAEHGCWPPFGEGAAARKACDRILDGLQTLQVSEPVSERARFA